MITPAEPTELPDRHASWQELFFDLVVVVAVSQLAHLLHSEPHHGPSGLEITTFFALYLAIWLVWTTFMLYANVLADKVRARSMAVGMAGIATMAASVPEGMSDRANIFAAAYLITSAVGSGAFTRSGQILASWSAATRNAGLAPWIVSFWVHDPWPKLSLWLLGLAMTLWFSVFSGRGDGEEMVARLNKHLARRRRSADLRRAGRDGSQPLVVAHVDSAHLGERLGLFVIIVLGEAMLQLVTAWSQADWAPDGKIDRWLQLAVVAGFVLLIELFALNVRYAFAEAHPYPPRVVLPLHFIVIAAITTLATALGAVAAAPGEHLAPATAWLLCVGMSGFLLVIAVLARGPARRWVLTAVVVALPLVTAALGRLLPAAVVVVVLAVAGGVQRWNLRRALASQP
jgi:low temperature requirement protein LtrA